MVDRTSHSGASTISCRERNWPTKAGPCAERESAPKQPNSRNVAVLKLNSHCKVKPFLATHRISQRSCRRQTSNLPCLRFYIFTMAANLPSLWDCVDCNIQHYETQHLPLAANLSSLRDSLESEPWCITYNGKISLAPMSEQGCHKLPFLWESHFLSRHSISPFLVCLLPSPTALTLVSFTYPSFPGRKCP